MERKLTGEEISNIISTFKLFKYFLGDEKYQKCEELTTKNLSKKVLKDESEVKDFIIDIKATILGDITNLCFGVKNFCEISQDEKKTTKKPTKKSPAKRGAK